jgi:hypothetical protein
VESSSKGSALAESAENVPGAGLGGIRFVSIMSSTTRRSYSWKSTTLKSETEVLRILAELRGQRWLCRGQPECYGNLLPTIDRPSTARLSRFKKLTLERQSIDLFRSTVQYSADPHVQQAKYTDRIALMLLRHYGVPTRLLDWSLSPYVAAYFSVCDHEVHDGEIWAFDERLYEKEGAKQWKKYPETTTDGSGDPAKFDHDLTTAFLLQQPSDWFVCQFYEGFPRQIAQQGVYSFRARFGRDHAEAIAHLLSRDDHYHRYIIRANLKPAIRRTLREKHGIWRGSLFPDLAGAAETARTVFGR